MPEATKPPRPDRLLALANAAGMPSVRVLADIRTNAVIQVNVDWDDHPDVVERCKRASALVELVKELKDCRA